MINKEHLLKSGVEEDKATQVIELLGTSVDKLYAEDGYAKAMDDIDRAILTSFQIPKNPDEKTNDYLKRVTSESVAKSLKIKEDELGIEIADLKTKLKAKPGDEKLMQELEDLKKEKEGIPDLIDEKVADYKAKFESSEKELNVFKKRTLLERFVPKFKDDIDQEFKDFKVNAAINEILEKMEIKDGEDGKKLVYDPVSHDRTEVGEYMAKKLDSIAFKKVNQNGGGAGGGGEGDGGAGGESKLKFADDAKDNDKIGAIKEHMGTQEGIADQFDPKFRPRFNELLRENDLSKYALPEVEK